MFRTFIRNQTYNFSLSNSMFLHNIHFSANNEAWISIQKGW